MYDLGNCAICGEKLDAEFVDIGVGWQQVTEEDCPNQCGHVLYDYSIYEEECIKNGETPEPFEVKSKEFLDYLESKKK